MNRSFISSYGGWANPPRVRFYVYKRQQKQHLYGCWIPCCCVVVVAAAAGVSLAAAFTIWIALHNTAIIIIIEAVLLLSTAPTNTRDKRAKDENWMKTYDDGDALKLMICAFGGSSAVSVGRSSKAARNGRAGIAAALPTPTKRIGNRNWCGRNLLQRLRHYNRRLPPVRPTKNK